MELPPSTRMSSSAFTVSESKTFAPFTVTSPPAANALSVTRPVIVELVVSTPSTSNAVVFAPPTTNVAASIRAISSCVSSISPAAAPRPIVPSTSRLIVTFPVPALMNEPDAKFILLTAIFTSPPLVKIPPALPPAGIHNQLPLPRPRDAISTLPPAVFTTAPLLISISSEAVAENVPPFVWISLWTKTSASPPLTSKSAFKSTFNAPVPEPIIVPKIEISLWAFIVKVVSAPAVLVTLAPDRSVILPASAPAPFV